MCDVPTRLRFVDLFAGLGGFHVALSGLGHDCVFACEIDSDLRKLYERNFGMRPEGDIRSFDPLDVPDHDILCAGFPCQPFSKAGDQRGFGDTDQGTLINSVVAIAEERQPRYLLLENVQNILRHQQGRTWHYIRDALEAQNYVMDARVFSPVQFGTPQVRKRAYMIGVHQDLWPPTQRGTRPTAEDVIRWPEPPLPVDLRIESVLDDHPHDAHYLSERHNQYLDTWQRFVNLLPTDEPLPTFPIWAMEFGATYPYEGATPYARGWSLDGYRGSLGQSLDGLTPSKTQDSLPPYALSQMSRFPAWKQNFIRQNRALYTRHKHRLREWVAELTDFAPSFQKFEWNCGDATRDINEHLVQFRSSGVRVKLARAAPSLVAMTTSLVPVLPRQRRYMTPREGARLQNLPEDFGLPHGDVAAFRAIGNAVNVEVVMQVVNHLLQEA